MINKTGERTSTKLGEQVKMKAWPKWNDYHIIAKGSHITLKINGQASSELIDNEVDHVDLAGWLGLQLRSGKPMTVQFKDVRLKSTN